MYVRIILISRSRTTSSTRKLDRKWQTHLCHPPDTGTSRGLLGLHEIFALYLAVTLAVPSSIRPAPTPRWQLPNGDVQPNCLLPRHVQRQRLGKLRSKYIRSRSSLHFPGPLLSNLELLAEHHSCQLSSHHGHEGSHRYCPP